MSKIIIDNQSSISDIEAVRHVANVINKGYLSGEKQYCWTSTFSDGTAVEARKPRGSTHSCMVDDCDQN